MNTRLPIRFLIRLTLAATLVLSPASAFAAGGNAFDNRDKLVTTLSTEGNEAWAPGYVDSLSDSQVRELNQALNNAEKSGLALNFDQELLQLIVDDNLDKHGIRAITLALEKEALFMKKYEKTGDEKFLMKAQAEKEKFLSRVDGPPASARPAKDDMAFSSPALKNRKVKDATLETRKAARDAAKEARKAAREAAKQAVKEAVKGGKKG